MVSLWHRLMHSPRVSSSLARRYLYSLTAAASELLFQTQSFPGTSILARSTGLFPLPEHSDRGWRLDFR